MRDFTVAKYGELLDALKAAGYRFVTYEQYIRESNNNRAPRGLRTENREIIVPDESKEPKTVILRHDVDKRPENSLVTAELEHRKGISASYYFRSVPVSFAPDIIHRIAELGHEIGYHYEDMSLCKGDKARAKVHFKQKLALLRTFYPVTTICMHGAPTSRYDGRALWQEYDYRDYGIIGEPYFDTDFSRLLYLTDTGRCWDGFKVSVRDKIPEYQDEWSKRGWTYHTTDQLIAAIRAGGLPSLMLTTHPQRWTDNPRAWRKERVIQTMKNSVKRIIVKIS